ncbi:amino acid synthesis family protein [Devosia sp. WQ 349]|uniref:amino acid synthesis family protein n=1 Tax=Devosia sp. WQ 349K1 TaxID=2800329 RepID=UPI001906FD83|nr:amino acid synthesis family protein [Devosia sp. WQ 349K1]MBK1795502.1 amino acid synthesis family protein [Devosia sp. WQ 349K1]
MDIKIRRTFTIIDDKYVEAGQQAASPLRKVAVVFIVENPYVGQYVEDLSGMVTVSAEIGRRIGEAAKVALGGMAVQGYGKGGVVGLGGEQEHANALLTTTFANPIRDVIGGAKAWISSFTKVSAPNALIDVPMNCKDDVYVRSHYDGMTIHIPDGPKADEIALIFCMSTGPRLNARVGGMTYEEAQG